MLSPIQGKPPVRNNLDKLVTFTLDGETFQFRLVSHQVRDGGQLNIASPVGQALLSAWPGADITVATPAGDSVVKVLSIRGD